MNITVLTPDREVYSGAITSLKVPGTEGQFQILRNHAPIVSSLEKGVVTIKKQGGEQIILNIGGGFVEVLNNEVNLLVHGVEA